MGIFDLLYQKLPMLGEGSRWFWAAGALSITCYVSRYLSDRAMVIVDTIVGNLFIIAAAITFVAWLTGYFKPESYWKWGAIIILWGVVFAVFLILIEPLFKRRTKNGE
jgi:hypothetical protein